MKFDCNYRKDNGAKYCKKKTHQKLWISLMNAKVIDRTAFKIKFFTEMRSIAPRSCVNPSCILVAKSRLPSDQYVCNYPAFETSAWLVTDRQRFCKSAEFSL